jgi:hypothetical protein
VAETELGSREDVKSDNFLAERVREWVVCARKRVEEAKPINGGRDSAI